MSVADGRFAARLAALPHDALLEIATQLANETTASRCITDAIIAQHDPFPAWAREDVLLSPDLLPHLFVHFEAYHAAVARVSRAWRDAWKATDDDRRWLRPAAPQPLAPDFKIEHGTGMAKLPADMGLFVSATDGQGRITDSNLRTIRELPQIPQSSMHSCQASDLGLFGFDKPGMNPRISRYELDGFTKAARYEEEETYRGYDSLTLANDLVFAIGYIDEEDGGEDEILCLDARTLTLRHKFGRGRFGAGGAWGMAVVDEELYVADKAANRIQIFSFSGEHLRNITVPFKKPERMVQMGGRIYLTDDDDDDEEVGRRIFVLSLSGEVLQKYMLPEGRKIQNLSLLGTELMCIHTKSDWGDGDGEYYEYDFQCLLLKGL